MTDFLVFIGSDYILGMLLGWCLACAVILLYYGVKELFGWLLIELIEYIDRRERRRRRYLP